MNTTTRITILIGVLLLAGIAAFIAYNAGVSQGIEQSGKVLTVPPNAGPVYVMHRPWGFGGFFLVPLFFIAFWLLLFRGMRHHRYACHRQQGNGQMKDA